MPQTALWTGLKVDREREEHESIEKGMTAVPVNRVTGNEVDYVH